MTAAAIARAARADNERIRREACATCGDRCAPFTCAWVCEMPTKITAFRAEVGDAWVTQQRGKIGRVVEIEYLDEKGRNVERSQRLGITMRLWVRLPGRKDPYPYMREPVFGPGLVTLRPGVCGARACERHVREVGEGVAYCRTHWRAWMEAA